MTKSCVLLLLILLSVKASSQSDSLVAVFHFNGNAVDSVMGREGSVDGPILVPDRFGNEEGAYEFDGDDDIIRVLDDELLRLKEDFTLAVWFMPYSIKDGVLFRKNSSQNQFPSVGYNVGVSQTGNHTFSISTDVSADGLSSQGPLVNEYALNEWNLIVASKRQDTIFMVTNVFGRGRYTFYAKQIEGTIGYDGSPLIIGSRSQLPANTFDGRIDEIRIYNQYVSLEELLGISFEDETTSVIDLDESIYSAYPNPFTDQITIHSDESFSNRMKVSLYDMLGRLVYQQDLHHDHTIETHMLDQGLYYLQLQTEQGVYVKTMIKGDSQ